MALGASPRIPETELARHVVAWLCSQHWDVYQEVEQYAGDGVIDIVAVRDRKVWAVETKNALTFAVLAQASKRLVHYRSVAVPSAKPDRRTRRRPVVSEGRGLALDVARYFVHVGVLEVFSDGSIDEVIPARLQSVWHTQAEFLMERLVPQQKTWAEAGNSDGARWSPYQETMRSVREFIAAHPGCTIGEIHAHVGDAHYSGSAKACLRKALCKWEKGWCRVEAGSRGFRFFIKEEKVGARQYSTEGGH